MAQAVESAVRETFWTFSLSLLPKIPLSKVVLLASFAKDKSIRHRLCIKLLLVQVQCIKEPVTFQLDFFFLFSTSANVKSVAAVHSRY